MNTLAEWFTPDKIPPDCEDPCFGKESIPVLGYTKFKRMKVVYCRQWGDEEGAPDPVQWYTTCADGWNVTDELLFWSFLPQVPTQK